MAVVSDFVMIEGDAPVVIGDTGFNPYEKNFNTGGREANQPAFLIFNIKGLTHTDQDVDVMVNSQVIGQIYRYGGGGGESRDRWYTQMIAMNGSVLNDGYNELQINVVSWPGAGPGNLYDDFELKDIMCFFHQRA